MLKSKNKTTSLYCFSPPVMLATFVLEVIMAFYVLYRYKIDTSTRLVATTLFALAVFQMSEFFVCAGTEAMIWSRIGFVAITALPPLGLHILNKISGHKLSIINKFAYGSMAVLMTYFLLSPVAFVAQQCSGNYVIFNLAPNMGFIYGTYYYGWLLTALLVGIYRIKRAKKANNKRTLGYMLLGYLVFIIPTALVNTINPSTMAGIPSIMCGFAVFFAVILALKITPNISKPETKEIKIFN